MIDEDIVSPDFYADEVRMHGAFEALRRVEPLRWMEPGDHDPFWAVTKHADLIEVERHADLFLSGPRTVLVPRRIEQQRPLVGGGRRILHPLPTMDAPDHRRYRAITRAWFQPARLAALRRDVEALADGLLDELRAAGGAIDFAQRVTARFPLRVILTMLGLPDEDPEPLRELIDQMFKPYNAQAAHPELADPGGNAITELSRFFEEPLADRVSSPRDDLLSVIAHAEIDGEPISHHAALSYCVVLLSAAHDGTAGTIGGGLHALISHPEQYRRLRADPAMLASGIEELLRFTSPIRSFIRTAAADTELRGQRIAAGQALLLLYPSANRDEDVFVDPHTLDVGRSPNPHVAFGQGPHVCLGLALGRMELHALFTRLIDQVAEFELAGPTEWTRSNFLGGPRSMPIRCKFD